MVRSYPCVESDQTPQAMFDTSFDHWIYKGHVSQAHLRMLNRTGSPSQAGIEKDAEAALTHVLGRLDVDADRIVVYGKSLGGAVALHIASEREPQIRAVMIENSFLSVAEMVPRIFPFLTYAFGQNGFLNFLVRNKWQNRDRVRSLKSTPLLLIASVKV